MTGLASGSSHLKLSVEITLPLIPSHQGRGKLLAPSPLVGEGWGEGAYKIKCEGPLDYLVTCLSSERIAHTGALKKRPPWTGGAVS